MKVFRRKKTEHRAAANYGMSRKVMMRKVKELAGNLYAGAENVKEKMADGYLYTFASDCRWLTGENESVRFDEAHPMWVMCWVDSKGVALLNVRYPAVLPKDDAVLKLYLETALCSKVKGYLPKALFVGTEMGALYDGGTDFVSHTWIVCVNE